jgi:hypothetical protein
MRIITLSQGRPEKALNGRCLTHILVPATWLTIGKSPGRICRGGSFAPVTAPCPIRPPISKILIKKRFHFLSNWHVPRNELAT